MSNLNDGVIGDICKEVVRQYAVINRQNPDENEAGACFKIWEFWAFMNSERIWKEENESFDIIKEKRAVLVEKDSVYNLFYDIVYVETGISKKDKKMFTAAMKILDKSLKRNKLVSEIDLKQFLRIE